MKLVQSLRSLTASAALASVALAVAGSLALAGLLWTERQRAVEAQVEQSEVFARVIEEQVTRSIETTVLSLAGLGAAVADGSAAAGVAGAPVLQQVLVTQPQIRAVAVLNSQAQILASSSPNEAGLQLQLAALGAPVTAGHHLVGSAISARSFAEIALGASASDPARVGSIPVVRKIMTRGGTELLAVALLNPDAIANQMRLTLGDANRQALLTTAEGTLLVSTSPSATNGRLTHLPLFGDLKAKGTSGNYLGAGTTAGTQLVAYRASRSLPLVVIIERPLQAVESQWLAQSGGSIAVGVTAILFLAAMGYTTSRSHRAREQSRQRLDLAQAEVARSERELNVIVQSVQELIFRTDAFGALTFVNACWATASGQEASASLGQSLAALVLPAERRAVRALFSEGEAVGARTAQATLWAQNGGGRRFDIAVVPLQADGQITGFAGSAIDVTDRLDAQARLQEQLAFSALLLEINPLPTSLLDLHGRYVNVNRAWEEFTGRSKRDVIGHDAREHLSPEEAAHHRRVDRELVTLGGSKRYEAENFTVDGTRRDLLLNKVLVPDLNGKPDGILCTFMDVSELRAAERATAEARDVAEEASRSKSEFIANISHELRTPLQSIIGFSELGMLRGREHTKLAGMFTDVHAAGQRMLALVNDLLDVSKLESSVGTFDLERTDLRPLIREVLAELAPLLTPKQLRIEPVLGSKPLLAKVDPLRIQQVVRNVLANAIKFSPPASAIDICAEMAADTGICITVRDRGPGVPPQELESIFEAFVQSSTTKDGSGGTGLGLAICRKIVEAHAGVIRAENAPDGGTRFHIQLPSRSFADTAPATDLAL